MPSTHQAQPHPWPRNHNPNHRPSYNRNRPPRPRNQLGPHPWSAPVNGPGWSSLPLLPGPIHHVPTHLLPGPDPTALPQPAPIVRPGQEYWAHALLVHPGIMAVRCS
ncbi:hypothetical protein LIER_09271 [Lithospermum erythrorhizon]|uniref:Uncharacterized protein n=1 Tax=Lithospermum erythrorhizon TaxID=34254 RepID=A0AAV3PG97_LITER